MARSEPARCKTAGHAPSSPIASSDTLPLTTVDDYADNFLAQQMSQVTGVAQVVIGGESKPAIRVQVDPAKLASAGITLEEVRNVLVNSTTNAAKGTINLPTKSFIVSANDQLVKPELYDDVVLAYRNGAPIRVRDVGHAVLDATDSKGLESFMDKSDADLGKVMKAVGIAKS